MTPNKFNAIVIGAGPAGSAAAYYMAKAELSVLLLERGEYPGAKNTSGALFYGEILNQLEQDLWQRAPVERWITSQTISVTGEKSSFELKYNNEKSRQHIGGSILRSRFDKWLAQKATDAGALLLTSTLAAELISTDGKVNGVKVVKEHGEVSADVVIIADGANSLMIEKAGLSGSVKPNYVGVGVKELIKLPARDIEQRFHVTESEGASYSFLGQCTQGIPGGCFLHTNRESLSLGLIANLESLKAASISPPSLLDLFKEQNTIAWLISGGVVKEYSAHLIPEGGYDTVPKLFSDGVMVVGDAAGLAYNSGFILRGMDFAIASGIAAAKTVIEAKKANDYSAVFLSRYKKILDESFVLKDLKSNRTLLKLIQSDRIYKDYPKWITQGMQDFFTIDENPRQKAFKIFMKAKPKNLRYMKIISDIFQGARNL